MKKYMIHLIVLILFYANIQAHEAYEILDRNDRCFFIENKGQWPEEVKYLSKIGGINAWITDFGVVYDYYKIIREKKQDDPFDGFKMHHHPADYDNARIKGHVVRAVLDGVNTKAKVIGKGKHEGYYNYFIGNDPDKWASEVGLFNEVEIQGIYDGIDIRYYYENGLVRYDYKVSAGADLSKIKFHLEGADGFDLNDEGELLIRTSLGEVQHGMLFAYQMDRGMEQEVECRFELRGEGGIGIKALEYDSNKELIIDPLVYSTFIGGADDESGCAIAIDNIGNVYISGNTLSYNYPTTIGAYDQFYNYYVDVFISKLNAVGDALIYSTFIGGYDHDAARAMSIDHSNNVYITGYTISDEYPVTSWIGNDYYPTLHGSHVFVTKLSESGTELIYSTIISGVNHDSGNDIVLDNNRNAYITGVTTSSDYPTTEEAYDRQFNSYGGSYSGDVFITKLNASGSALVYSTFIGGIYDDSGNAIALDQNGNVYVTGYTYSRDYPTTSGAYDLNYNLDYNFSDVFVTKLNADGSALVYSTFIGGMKSEYTYAIELDAYTNAYIVGETGSTDYPTISGAFDRSLDGKSDAFITKLNASGTGLVYSGFLGGSNSEAGNSILVDSGGNALIAGYTGSNDFSTTSGAYDRSYNGRGDVFITKFNAEGTELLYSSFIGGSNSDYGHVMTLDENENVYITGMTYSNDYPITNWAYDKIHNGGSDVFVTKLYIEPSAPSQITLSFPNGGERLAVGTPYTIAWDTDEPIGNVKIDISTTGGSTWWDVMQGESTANDGSYLYTPVVENISDHCLFRITSIENPAVSDQSDGEFRIVSLPKPTHHAKEIPSYLTEPQIDGVLDDPIWTTISEVDSLLFGGFSLAWTLPWANFPDNLVTWKACWSSNTNCLYVAVEVEDDIKGDYDNEPNDPAPYLPFNDESLEFFLDGDHHGDFYADHYDLAQHWRVSGKNVRNLTDYPNVNEYSVYTEGDFITGTHYSNQGGNWICEAKIKIYDLFKSNPKNLQIGDTLGFELWYNDSDNEKYSGQCYVRDHQTGWAYAGPAYDDASFFGDIILTEGDNSYITVLSPNGGEDIGCSTTITWTSVGTSTNVRLEYYCNGVWNTIINSTSNDGSYIWNIPPNTICQSKIKIIDAANTGCWDMSDDYFNIDCSPCKSGDVNNDGYLTPSDALCAFQIYLHGGTLPSGTACDNECALFAADVNCTLDGITPGDALYIFQSYLGGKTLPLDCKPTALPKENSDLAMTITSEEGRPGEEVVFTIEMDRPESIRAFGLDMGYPAELLTFVDIRATGMTEKWDVLDGQINVDGVVTIGGFDPVVQRNQSPGKLVNIVFKVNEGAEGIGDLWLFNVTDDLAMADCRPGRFSTAIEGIRRLGGPDIPDTYRLEQNYPNPFNMDTEIMYQLPEAGFVTVTIYNSVGHQIRILVNQHQEPGKYAARWDGKDDLRNDIPSGVYIYQIRTDEFRDSRKMMIIK